MKESVRQPTSEIHSAYACWQALQKLSDQLWERYHLEFLSIDDLDFLNEEYLAQETPFPEVDEDDIPF
jgi:hypothetical protein